MRGIASVSEQAGVPESPAIRRLQGWKDIAAYLDRDVRTVQRWEKFEGLPIYRLQHLQRAVPYAFESELDAWRTSRTTAPALVDAAPSQTSEAVQLPDTPTAFAVVATESRGHSRLSRRFIAAAAVIVLTSAGGWWKYHAEPRRAFRERDWALVTAFDNRTGDPQFDGILEHVLSYELSQSPYLSLVSADRVNDVLRLMARPETATVDATLGREVALRDGAIHAVMSGTIERLGNGYAMTVRVSDPETDSSMVGRREEASTPADVQIALRRLANWIRVTLGESPLSVKRTMERLEHVTTPSLAALRLYSEAQTAAKRSHWAEAEALLTSALAEDRQFASAHILLAWTRRQQLRSADSYRSVAKTAFDLADTTTDREQFWIRGSYYDLTNQPALAIGQYEALVRRYPDDFWGARNLMTTYQNVGRMEDAADLAGKIADARPNDFTSNVDAANVLLLRRSFTPAWPYMVRSRALLDSLSADIRDGTTRSYVALSPVHELWVQGRITEAANLFDQLALSPEVKRDISGRLEGDWTLRYIGTLNMMFGRLRLAEAAYSQIRQDNLRALCLAELSVARGDLPAVVESLQHYTGSDFAAISYLVRAGNLDAARRLLAIVNANQVREEWSEEDRSQNSRWAASEIEQVNGNVAAIQQALRIGVPWARRMSGVRAYLYSETLARAATPIDATRAATILEETGTRWATAYTYDGDSAYFWMRTQLLLADIYRIIGQPSKARSIEMNLLSRLAVADADFPLLVELQRRKNAS